MGDVTDCLSAAYECVSRLIGEKPLWGEVQDGQEVEDRQLHAEHRHQHDEGCDSCRDCDRPGAGAAVLHVPRHVEVHVREHEADPVRD